MSVLGEVNQIRLTPPQSSETLPLHCCTENAARNILATGLSRVGLCSESREVVGSRNHWENAS